MRVVEEQEDKFEVVQDWVMTPVADLVPDGGRLDQETRPRAGGEDLDGGRGIAGQLLNDGQPAAGAGVEDFYRGTGVPRLRELEQGGAAATDGTGV